MLEISDFLPQGIALGTAWMLVGLSFVTAAITAALGLGGGILMLGALTFFFSPAVAVPVHGAIQLGANASRAALLWPFIQWRVMVWIGVGIVIGSFLGGSLAVNLPEALFTAMIAGFILVSAWAPQPRVSARGPLASFSAGLCFGTLGMILGAVGPLLAGFLKFMADRRELVGTHSAIMMLSHVAKISAFTFFGFAFGQFLPLVTVMIVAGVGGTWAGSRLLHRMPEAIFRVALKVLLTVIALDMLRRAILG